MTKQDDEELKNGGIFTLSAIIKHVMASASEAELAAHELFLDRLEKDSGSCLWRQEETKTVG